MALDIKILIGKKVYYIKSDQRQYILGSDKTFVSKDDGETKTKFEPYGFYTSLISLFNAVIHMKVRMSTAKTLEELKQEIIKAREDVMGYWETGLVKEGGELHGKEEDR